MTVFQISVSVKDPKVRGQLVNQLVHANFSVRVRGQLVEVAAPDQSLGKAFRAYTFVRNRVFAGSNRFAKQRPRHTEQPNLTDSLSEVPCEY